MLDTDLERKLRLLQGRLIQKTKGNVSFSQVINDTLASGLKSSRS